jgi:hypothetical protein
MDPEENGGNGTTATAPATDSQPAATSSVTSAGSVAAPAIGGSTAPQPQAEHYAPDAQLEPEKMQQLEKLQKDSWGERTLHGILDAIGGKYSTQFIPTPNGVIQRKVANTPGQQWKNIIAGALTGYAAGAGMTGPGSTARKFGAGFQASQGQVEKQRDKSRAEANEDFEQQQKAAHNNAANALLGIQIAKGTFDLGQDQVKATTDEFQREADAVNAVKAGGEGSTDYGVFATFPDLMKKVNDVPELHDVHYAGNIHMVPHVNADHKIDGVHLFLVTPTWREAKVQQPLKMTNKVTGETQTIPAGALNGNDFMATWMKGSADDLAEHHKDVEEKREGEVAKSTEAKNYGEAARAKSESVPNAGTPEVEQDISSGLASGRYLMGKDIPLRTSKDQTTAAQYTKDANVYSMQHFGLPYSPEIIRQEAKFAESPKTQAFLGGVDRMVGTPGMPGQLDQVLDLARRAGIGELAPANDVTLWIRQHLGEQDAKNFEQGLSDTQTALGTLIGNPLLGSGESDLKLKTAQKQFGSNPTMKDLRGAVTTTKEILNRARGELARNNRYIQQRYGTDLSPQQQPGAGQPGAGQGQGGTQPPPGQTAPRTVPPGAFAARDAKGNIVGYKDTTGYHPFQ